MSSCTTGYVSNFFQYIFWFRILWSNNRQVVLSPDYNYFSEVYIGKKWKINKKLASNSDCGGTGFVWNRLLTLLSDRLLCIYTEVFYPLLLSDAMWQMNLRSSETMESGTYPERPGEPDCSYYIRTGLCRFGATCRFNHPPNRKLV